MSLKDTFGNIFHRGAKGTEQPAPAAEVAPEVEPTLEQKVAAGLGPAGTELANQVAAAETNGTLDTVPAAPTPASPEVALTEAQQQLAALPEANNVETFVPPTPQEVEVAPVAPQTIESAPLSSQPEVAVEADETQIMGDQFTIKAPAATTSEVAPDTGDPESNAIWKELDPTGATLPVSTEAPAPSVTTEQNQ